MRAPFLLAVFTCAACPEPATVTPSPLHDEDLPIGDDPVDDPIDDVADDPVDPDPVDPVPPQFTATPTNVPEGRLCDVGGGYVDNGGDPANPPCALEVNNDIAPLIAPDDAPSELRVIAWNIRFGESHDELMAELTTNPELVADVLLLSEVGRDDSRSNPVGVHQARDIANALGMNYAFGVEWDHRYVEDYAEPKGEHGVAVLSRFPLGELTPIRHTPANDFWENGRRIGGRITLGATLLVGDHLARVYASHLCTRPTPLPDDGPRAVQGAEIRFDTDTDGRPAIEIVGGDLNTWTCNPAQGDCSVAPRSEQVIEDFLTAGWSDGLAGFTGFTHLGEGFFPQRLDWIFTRGAAVTPGGRIDAGGSDHFAVTTLVHLR